MPMTLENSHSMILRCQSAHDGAGGDIQRAPVDHLGARPTLHAAPMGTVDVSSDSGERESTGPRGPTSRRRSAGGGASRGDWSWSPWRWRARSPRRPARCCRGLRRSGGRRGRGGVSPRRRCARRSSLVARRSSLVARRSSLVARRSSLVARRSSLVARRSSLVARRSSLVARRSSLVARRSSLVVRGRGGARRLRGAVCRAFPPPPPPPPSPFRRATRGLGELGQRLGSRVIVGSEPSGHRVAGIDPVLTDELGRRVDGDEPVLNLSRPEQVPLRPGSVSGDRLGVPGRVARSVVGPGVSAKLGAAEFATTTERLS